MRVAAEPISPELVLVCPELAVAARAALPDHPRFVRTPAPTAAVPLVAVAAAYAGLRVVGLALSALLWISVLALVVTAPLLF